MRADMIDHVWAGGSVPTRLADSVVRDTTDTHDPITGMAQWDRFRINNVGGRGGYSFADWITPTATENGRILVVHTGHDIPWYWLGDPEIVLWPMLNTVNAALAEGYCIMALSMPTFMPNPTPDILTVDGEQVEYVEHTYTGLDEDGGTASACRFIEPVIVAINQALVERPGYTVAMIGHSGGGWTCEHVSAIDTRIVYSASVFGSLPWWDYTGADYEQNINNPIRDHGGMPIDRHTMRGQGRRAVNVVALLDDAFPVAGHQIWMDAFGVDVQNRLDVFGGGEYAVWYDEAATRHSDWGGGSAYIFDDINDYLARRGP